MSEIVSLSGVRAVRRLAGELNAVEAWRHDPPAAPIALQVELTALMRAGATTKEMADHLDRYSDPVAWRILPKEFS